MVLPIRVVNVLKGEGHEHFVPRSTNPDLESRGTAASPSARSSGGQAVGARGAWSRAPPRLVHNGVPSRAVSSRSLLC